MFRRWFRENVWIRFTDPKRYHYKQERIKVSQYTRDAFKHADGQLTLIKRDGSTIKFDL